MTTSGQLPLDTFGPITVRLVMLNPREGLDRRYYVVDLDEDGVVTDAAWVGSRAKVEAWMDRPVLTGDRRTIANVGDFIDRGWLVNEQQHLRTTQTSHAVAQDALEVASWDA